MINKVVTKAVSYIEKSTGFYTKKGCIRAATEVGKDLADLCRAGKELTSDEIRRVFAQRIPNLKLPELASDKKELMALLQKNGADEFYQRFFSELLYGKGATPRGLFSPVLKGIFYKKDLASPLSSTEIIAHEAEHYMEFYANPQIIIKRFFRSLSPGVRRFKVNYKARLERALNSPDKDKILDDWVKEDLNRADSMSIHVDLMDYFGVLHALSGKPRIFKGFAPTEDGFVKYLASDAYNGLYNDKRVDAYIRGVMRHSLHPGSKRKNAYKNLRDRLKSEANAYQVSDNMVRYIEGQDALSYAKIRSLVFKRALKIVDKELWLARFGKCKQPKWRCAPIIAVNQQV